MAELADVIRECSEPGWDGYGAKPVTPGAAEHMRVFLDAVPRRLPKADFSADPDGCLTAEWSVVKKILVNVSLDGEGRLCWMAFEWGEEPRCGEVDFDGDVPQKLMRLLERVVMSGFTPERLAADRAMCTADGWESTGALVVVARETLPQYIDAVELLQAEIERLRADIRELSRFDELREMYQRQCAVSERLLDKLRRSYADTSVPCAVDAIDMATPGD